MDSDYRRLQASVLQAFAPGTQVGQSYVVEAPIGCGAMGVVVRAVDTTLERRVAIKVVMLAKYADVLRSEAVVMARLRHENLLQIHAFGEHRGFSYFVMELVDGTSLASLLKREGPLPLLVACGILHKVGAALAVVHGAGIVHRDIKPGNVLIGRDYRVALADFGLVATEAKGRVSGTPSYVAPELVEGIVLSDGDHHLSDQYSLAVTAFEMLTGTLPFKADAVHALLVKRVLEPPPAISSRRPGLSPAIDAIFARALARDPHDRFPDCASFVAALEAEANKEKEGEGAGKRTRCILVVDDDDDMVQLYQTVFEALEDVEVTCTKDGLVGLEFARADPPSVIFLDLQMPRFNGIDFIVKALADERLRSVPIVVISSMLDADNGASSAESFGSLREILTTMGVKAQIPKPVSLEVLLRTAEQYLPPLINVMPTLPPRVRGQAR
jgi:eukaryotic-like serine/threonine-protein kinase